MLSIPTVASEFERDFDLYSHGKLSRDDFNHLYGHLRLGTYDYPFRQLPEHFILMSHLRI